MSSKEFYIQLKKSWVECVKYYDFKDPENITVNDFVRFLINKEQS